MPWNYREQLVATGSEPDGRRGPPGDVALSDARSP
jgi:hypothetical protein